MTNLLIIIGAFGGALAAVVALWSLWEQRVERQRGNEDQGYEFLEKARRCLIDAERLEPKLLSSEYGKPKDVLSQASDEKRYQDEKLIYEKEDKIAECKTLLRRISRLGLPTVEEWREYFDIAARPILELDEYANLAGWRLFRFRYRSRWWLLQLPPFMWKGLAGLGIASLPPPDSFLKQLYELTYRGKLKHTPRGLRSQAHPAWKVFRTWRPSLTFDPKPDAGQVFTEIRADTPSQEVSNNDR